MSRCWLVWLGLVLWTAAAASVSAIAQCFYPDGSLATDFTWVPCNGSYGPASGSCCVPDEGDQCGADGLCSWTGHYQYRATCSDRTWQDPSCAGSICPGLQPSTYLPLSQCTASLFCCEVTSNCCTDGSQLFSLSNNTAPVPPHLSSSTSPSATSPSVTSSPHTSSPLPSSSDNSTANSAPLGVVVGAACAALVVLLAAGVAVFCCMRQRQRRKQQASQYCQQSPTGQHGQPWLSPPSYSSDMQQPPAPWSVGNMAPLSPSVSPLLKKPECPDDIRRNQVYEMSG